MKTPLPEHPEPHTYTWTKLEEESIRAAMVAAYNEAIEDAAKVCTKDAEQFAKDDWQSTALACYACTNTIRKMKETP